MEGSGLMMLFTGWITGTQVPSWTEDDEGDCSARESKGKGDCIIVCLKRAMLGRIARHALAYRAYMET